MRAIIIVNLDISQMYERRRFYYAQSRKGNQVISREREKFEGLFVYRSKQVIKQSFPRARVFKTFDKESTLRLRPRDV